VIITETAWGKLTDAQKAIIVEAGNYASDFNAQLSAQIESKCKAELQEAGVTFTQVSDLKPWQDACAEVISQFSKGMEEDYMAILDMAR
jgi:TRAP-type C4-dicarboxylate transport system substrate-binding protein